MTRFRLFALLVILLFPMLTLVPLGSLWLWQNHLVLPWVLGALAFTLAMYAFASYVLPIGAASKDLARSRGGAGPSADGLLTEKARDAVDRLANTTDPATIRSRGDLLDLAVKTIDVVAREFHPGDKTPVWNFTVPEMLLLTERVSGRLRPLFIDNIPLGEQLTVGQMIRLYEWRSIVGMAEGAYDLWRLVRVVNPLAALTQEARERVTRQVIASVKDDLTRRIIRMLVTEVGDASIELYSGVLREHMAAEAGQPRDGQTVLQRPAQPSPPKSRLGTAWNEIGKAFRGSRALYRKPRAPSDRNK